MFTGEIRQEHWWLLICWGFNSSTAYTGYIPTCLPAWVTNWLIFMLLGRGCGGQAWVSTQEVTTIEVLESHYTYIVDFEKSCQKKVHQTQTCSRILESFWQYYGRFSWGRGSKNKNGKGLTLVQALGSRGDRSLLIGWFLLRLSDFSLVGNITDHGRILYQTKCWNSGLSLNYDLVLISLN